MLLDVVEDRRDVHRREDRVRSEHRVGQVADVRLQVGEVVLLGESRDWSAKRGGDVLVHRVLLGRLHGRVEQILGVRHLQRLKQTLLDLAQVVELRQGGRALGHGLHLSVALRLAEDVRVGHRHDVEHAVEVLARGQLLARLILKAGIVEVVCVQAVEDAQHAPHRVVQACVDGRVDHRALL